LILRRLLHFSPLSVCYEVLSPHRKFGLDPKREASWHEQNYDIAEISVEANPTDSFSGASGLARKQLVTSPSCLLAFSKTSAFSREL